MSIEAPIPSSYLDSTSLRVEDDNNQNPDLSFSEPSPDKGQAPKITPLMEEVLIRSRSMGTIKELLQEVLVEQNTTLREAERMFQVADSTIHAWKIESGIEGRSFSSTKNNTKLMRSLNRYSLDGDGPKQTLEKLYSRYSLRELADILKVSHDAVRGALIKFDVPRREPHYKKVSKDKLS